MLGAKQKRKDSLYEYYPFISIAIQKKDSL
jgi:hypothetical protein